MFGHTSSVTVIEMLDVLMIQLSFPQETIELSVTPVSHSHASSRLTLVAADSCFGRGLVIPIKPLRLLVRFLVLTPEVPVVSELDEAVE